ncbi:MAG: glycoside hydrolase family 172 protein, partial [Armatimonadota bacterium]
MSIQRLAAAVFCALVLLMLGAGVGYARHPTRVTCDMLLRQMIDMERLATVPDPGVESDQQSSYDRRSVEPGNDDWFANGDRGKFIREEQRDGRTEYVMAEMDGPGAVLRLWSANPQDGGTIRIYIDDLAKPALEADFLALTSAKMPEFPDPFSGIRARGANLYFPMPYQERCKVTVDIGKLYYHVGYRTFPKGTEVEPFSAELLPKLRGTMHEVARVLARPAERFGLAGAQRHAEEGTLSPGEAMYFDLDGPRAIVRMEVQVDVPEERLSDALREPILTIRFDDEKEPCVWAPLGDFFGSTPGLNPHQSLPVGMRENGVCYSNWYMPFGKRALVTVTNLSREAIDLRFALWDKPAEFRADEHLYFRAKWRNEWLPADPRFLDWRMLEATGPGRFVGVMMGVMNTKPRWWGEGDEKVWVDDDTFPSFFGTGSEDYFGYAWCNTALFSHAYHNQSIVTGPGNFGYTAV